MIATEVKDPLRRHTHHREATESWGSVRSGVKDARNTGRAKVEAAFDYGKARTTGEEQLNLFPQCR
jgi:hypothetical protein